jgi:hypothetical protein
LEDYWAAGAAGRALILNEISRLTEPVKLDHQTPEEPLKDSPGIDGVIPETALDGYLTAGGKTHSPGKIWDTFA